ncbi:MAG: hypothetical protein LBS83_03285 [Holosporales bacterium]|jgi:hypothetical protein|nr:hypothetical protein [Holosporales bacterium]
MSYEKEDLFGAKEVFQETPFLKVQNTQGSSPPKFPIISMKNAFYKGEAVSDAMFIIRFLANQYAKNASDKNFIKKFLNALKSEISIKNGNLEAELASRDALMHKFF